jgi:hypothetical protein
LEDKWIKKYGEKEDISGEHLELCIENMANFRVIFIKP